MSTNSHLYKWLCLVIFFQGLLCQEQIVFENDDDADYPAEDCVDIGDCEHMMWIMRNKDDVQGKTNHDLVKIVR